MKYASIACAVLLLVAGCNKSSPGADQSVGRHPWTQPGVLRVAVVSEPKSLNPLLASATADVFIDRLMFEPLISADQHGRPVPILVTQVPALGNRGISRDGLTITYRLRKDAKWTDGTPVTSQDVKYSWLAIVNPNNNVISRHGYDAVASIDTPNTATAILHLKYRFAPLVNTFFAESDQPYGIAPAHVLAKYSNINQLPFNQEPTVSDGPFRFASWTHGDRIVLDANRGFFKGAPQLDRVEIHIVPDENTAVNLLRTHAVDYLFQASINTYPTLKYVHGARIVWVDMNGFEGLEFNVSRPGVSDSLVRRAIAHAFDKAALAARLTHGQLKVASGDLPDWMWAHDPSVKSPAYDPVQAKRLLTEAGYSFGSDGMARKDGVPLQLLLSTDTANDTHREESLLVQEALHHIGVAVEIKYYPQNLLYATAGMGGILQSGKFDMTLAPWYAGIDPDDSSQFTCAMRPPNGYNTAFYCDPDMEAAQKKALSSYDQGTRAAAYSEIQHLLARDLPYVFFWWQRQQEAVSVDFKGFSPNPVVESWNAWQWSI